MFSLILSVFVLFITTFNQEPLFDDLLQIMLVTILQGIIILINSIVHPLSDIVSSLKVWSSAGQGCYFNFLINTFPPHSTMNYRGYSNQLWWTVSPESQNFNSKMVFIAKQTVAPAKMQNRFVYFKKFVISSANFYPSHVSFQKKYCIFLLLYLV